MVQGSWVTLCYAPTKKPQGGPLWFSSDACKIYHFLQLIGNLLASPFSPAPGKIPTQVVTGGSMKNIQTSSSRNSYLNLAYSALRGSGKLAAKMAAVAVKAAARR